MSDTSVSTPTPTPDPPDQSTPDFHQLRTRILTNLALALDHASLRLSQAAAGQSVFTSPDDLKLTRSLLDILPKFFELLDKADVDDEPWPEPNIPLIPRCEICGQGPGAHWTEDCPQNPNPRKTCIL